MITKEQQNFLNEIEDIGITINTATIAENICSNRLKLKPLTDLFDKYFYLVRDIIDNYTLTNNPVLIDKIFAAYSDFSVCEISKIIELAQKEVDNLINFLKG